MTKIHYNWQIVRGVNCIVWATKTSDTGLTNRQKQLIWLRKKKTILANINTPILDTRKKSSRTQFCDIILYTDNTEDWDAAIRDTYFDHRQEASNVQGGYQIIPYDKEDERIYMSVLVYRASQWLMIQPGDRNEKHLLTFLSDFQGISNSVSPTSSQPIIDSPLSDRKKQGNKSVPVLTVKLPPRKGTKPPSPYSPNMCATSPQLLPVQPENHTPFI